MSTSFSSHIVVGVPLKDIYVAELRDDKKTKYNEDSGQPYEVTVKKLYATFGNHICPPVECIDKEKTHGLYASSYPVYQKWDFLENHGVQVHCQHSFGDHEYLVEHGVVGIMVASGDKDRFTGASLLEINEAIRKVQQVLVQFNIASPIKVYSQLQWG